MQKHLYQDFNEEIISQLQNVEDRDLLKAIFEKSKLTNSMKEVIELRFFEDMTIDDISFRLKMPKRKVEKLEQNALEKMRKSLNNVR